MKPLSVAERRAIAVELGHSRVTIEPTESGKRYRLTSAPEPAASLWPRHRPGQGFAAPVPALALVDPEAGLRYGFGGTSVAGSEKAGRGRC